MQSLLAKGRKFLLILVDQIFAAGVYPHSSQQGEG